MNNFYVLTGAPGSGKSAILNELARQGYIVVAEPARQIITEQRSIDGEGIYDKNPFLFKELMLSRSIQQYKVMAQRTAEVIIFDRGIPDIQAYSKCFQLEIGSELKASEVYSYNPVVFFAPSWEAIYANDDERKMSFVAAKDFGDNLRNIYTQLGYKLLELPCAPVNERVSFIIEVIKAAQ